MAKTMHPILRSVLQETWPPQWDYLLFWVVAIICSSISFQLFLHFFHSYSFQSFSRPNLHWFLSFVCKAMVVGSKEKKKCNYVPELADIKMEVDVFTTPSCKSLSTFHGGNREVRQRIWLPVPQGTTLLQLSASAQTVSSSLIQCHPQNKHWLSYGSPGDHQWWQMVLIEVTEWILFCIVLLAGGISQFMKEYLFLRSSKVLYTPMVSNLSTNNYRNYSILNLLRRYMDANSV